MRKINKIGLYALTALLSFSCSEHLDVKPYGRTIPKTAEEFSALLHTHLNRIDRGEDRLLVGSASTTALFDAGLGDDFEVSLTEAGSSLKNYVGDYFNTAREDYGYLYQVIRDCNIVLSEMKESGTEISDKVKATAYAMRGVAYYQLMRLFCEAPQKGQYDNQLGVPLVTTFDIEERPLRSSLRETIDRIAEDLSRSAAYGMNDDIYRFTHDAVRAYQARFYLWTEQWQQALDIARELLAKHPLLERQAYADMMNTAFDLKGNQLIKANRLLSESGNSGTVSTTEASIKKRPVSKRFLDAFDDAEKTTDIRYSLSVNPKRLVIKKFFCGARAAELKLIEAECCYHLGDEAGALTAINDLRARRIDNYVPLTAATLTPAKDTERIGQDALGNTLTPLMATILRERRKELFFECDRFFELKRNGSPEFWTAYEGLKYTTRKYMYALPIPVYDTELVKGLVQNPGYETVGQ